MKNTKEIQNAECKMQNERGAMELAVKIGDEVYSVLMPMIPELDGPAKIKPWRVYGIGVNKDGVAFVVNEFEEIYKLDDEDEGLAFSTREKAEEFLRKVIGNSEE